MNHQPFCRGVEVLPSGVHKPLNPEDCPCQNLWLCQTHRRMGPHPNHRRFPSVHGGKVQCVIAALGPLQACVCCCPLCEAARVPATEEVKAVSA